MIEELRRLPSVVRPLPDEPLDSWLEAIAHFYDVTLGEMSIALGLVQDADAGKAGWMSARWVMRITDSQAEHLEAATGLPADEFRQMTRERFWQFGVRHASSGHLSSASPVAGNGGRFCPDCLRDSGGRWRMTWQLPTGFACLRHRRLLADACPRCGLPPRRRGHPSASIPLPGFCHNQEPGATVRGARCRGDLTLDADRCDVTDAVLEAQRTVFRVLASGRASFGMFERFPQPAIDVLQDLRLLARLCRDLARAHAETIMGEFDDTLKRRFLAESSIEDSARSRPELSINIAVGVTLAVRALSERERTLEILRSRVAVSPNYGGHTPQLQELLASAAGRQRRPTTMLQSAKDTAGDPSMRARKLPIMLWDSWARRLAPQRVDREIAATALSAATVLVGTTFTHAAALKLLDQHAPTRRVTSVMRQLGHSSWENSTLVALSRLAAHLDEIKTAIDYGRRRALDLQDVLPVNTWIEICREANVRPGGVRRHATAQHHLFQRLTGSALSNAPACWRDVGSVTFSDVTQFRTHAPLGVRMALDGVGVELLARHDIGEPLTWEPSEELLADLDLPATPSTGGIAWPSARPARATASAAVPAMPGSYQDGESTRILAARTGVSRQTVARVLHEAAMTPRRSGRQKSIDVDRDWLHAKYLDERLTISQIAELVECSTTSIGRLLREAGIPARARGGSNSARALQPHSLAGDSPLLRATLIGQNSIERARRFLVVVERASIHAAAADIGVPPANLRAQLGRLSDAAGDSLFDLARTGAITLTSLGQKLASELRAALPAAPTASTTVPGAPIARTTSVPISAVLRNQLAVVAEGNGRSVAAEVRFVLERWVESSHSDQFGGLGATSNHQDW